MNYELVKEKLDEYHSFERTLSENDIKEIKLIGNPAWAPSKGRPKGHKRTLNLYEKLKQADARKVIFFLESF